MSAILVNVAGGDALVDWFAGRPAALDAQLGPAFAGIAQALYARVLGNLAGDVVKAGSGKLRDAITQDSDARSATIGVGGDAPPYAAALEFGATIPEQLIAIKNGKALAFAVGGSQVFAKHVMHRAFALPPHSFLRAALAELAPDMVAALDEAVAAAMQS
jgi:phage gpG-like protein